jgi:hypothetical protein
MGAAVAVRVHYRLPEHERGSFSRAMAVPALIAGAGKSAARRFTSVECEVRLEDSLSDVGREG